VTIDHAAIVILLFFAACVVIAWQEAHGR